MEQYEPIELVQKAARWDDHFDANEFKRLLSELTGDQFNKFCKRIIYLTQFHDNHIAAISTEDVSDFKEPANGWELT